MKNANNSINYQILDLEDYENLVYSLNCIKNSDNSDECDKLIEKLMKMKELYENS